MASSTAFTLITAFLLLSFLLFSTPAAAFNITKMLANYPDFSSFSSALTQTQVADQINSRQTITILVVDNRALSSVSGKPADELKKVLSLHVVLDYYDMDKLKSLPNKTGLLTTLFQSTGQATGQMGFLNATVTSGGVELGSAVPGAGLNAQLVKLVVAQPYNISVLQISSVIVPQGIGSSGSKNGSVPASSPMQAPTPAASPKQAPSPKKAPSPDAASPSDDAATPSPSKAKPPAAAKAPSSDAPSSDAPSAAANAPADGQSAAAAADAPGAAAAAAADAPRPSGDSNSVGSRLSFGASLAVVVGIAALVAVGL